MQKRERKTSLWRRYPLGCRLFSFVMDDHPPPRIRFIGIRMLGAVVFFSAFPLFVREHILRHEVERKTLHDEPHSIERNRPRY
jgi:hypothetical protein